ncbi:MAG: hypothetical protein H0U63_05680 [Burkholderiales bacterium]|nr:hypothetical protein [Burkholderiales bacterium]
MQQRSFADVPAAVLIALCIALLLQIAAHFSLPKPSASAQSLPTPPSLKLLRAASLGEPVAAAKWLMLNLQAFDNQPGVSIPFLDLDYGKVIGWLDHIVELDPRGQYPLLSASRLYAEVPDPVKQRRMLNFVHEKFLQDPNRRWPWLAHAVVVARHRLGDLPLARAYARSLREQATGNEVPHWVTQMDALLAADMDEVETARVLLGGLLASGKVTDPHELHFLKDRLEVLEKGAAKGQRSR